jgi:hypothetical protein
MAALAIDAGYLAWSPLGSGIDVVVAVVIVLVLTGLGVANARRQKD